MEMPDQATQNYDLESMNGSQLAQSEMLSNYDPYEQFFNEENNLNSFYV